MESFIKKIIIAITIVVALAATGYGAIKLYNWVIKDATERIKKGVSDGVGQGIGSAFNPFKWGKSK